jgi:heavy metal-binding protein
VHGRLEVAPATPPLANEFNLLRANPEWSDERRRLEPYAGAPPDKTLAFIAEMDMGTPEGDVIYACPMHPEVVGEESERCPKCGMNSSQSRPRSRTSARCTPRS